MRNLILSFLCLCQFTVTAQMTVDQIRLEGLEKTKPSYLRQFIHTETGKVLDSAQLASDVQRLSNLEILSHASYRVIQSSDSLIVVFTCSELHSLLPVANFGGIDENFWFQLGATEVNLAGRGHKLYAYYQYYDRHSAAVHATFDWIKSSPWGLNLNFVKWSTLEPLFFNGGTVEYNYDNYTYGAEGIYHLNFRDKITAGGAYFTERYEAASPLVTDAPALDFRRKMLAKMIFRFDHADHHFFYVDGLVNQLHLEAVYSFANDPDFYIVFNDLRLFRRIGRRGNFASRWRIGLSTNQSSPFAPFVLDSFVNIRGVGNRVDRGTGSIVANLEYRHAVLDGEVLALQVVGFVDMGTWRNPGGQLDDFIMKENFQSFVGPGARFIHKKIYNAIFRIDLGIDLMEKDSHGFVIGIGQYF